MREGRAPSSLSPQSRYSTKRAKCCLQSALGRPLAGLWEFPGGKVDPGEDPETALIRELMEELGIEIARADLVPLTFASHAYPEFHLLMPLYLCKRWEGDIAAQENQELLWVKPDELRLYDMPPADEPLKTSLPNLI